MLQVANETGLAAQECTLRAADLATAEEIFVTNALIGVLPVRARDGTPRRPGPVTRALPAGLARRFAADAAGA
ncbi:MAG: hypothetical protein PVS2B3_16410 [Steroidobacteraceae bacterium]